MEELPSNNAHTTLAGAITDSATALTLASATLFPTAGNFRLRCEDEIMLATAIAGDVVTVTRGAEGTTAAAHADGSPVIGVLSKGAMTQLRAYPAAVVTVPASNNPIACNNFNAWHEALTITVTTRATSRLRIDASLSAYLSSSGTLKLGVTIDGAQLDPIVSNTSTGNAHASVHALTDVLTPGSHTVALNLASDAATATLHGGSANAAGGSLMVQEVGA